MGAKQSVNYAVAVSEKKEGETAIYRHPKSVNGLKSQYDQNITNFQQVIEKAHKQYKDKPFVGKRDLSTNQFVYTTYGQEYNDARAIGSAIILNKLQNHVEDGNIKLNGIGIFAKNRQEWNQVDMSCALYGFTCVPLYDTLGAEAISYVFQNSGISTCFCQAASVQTILKTDKLHQLRNIVSFDPVSQEEQASLKKKGLHFFQYSELLKQGAANIQELPKIDEECILAFSYTSGTTGNPKGAMISHKNLISIIAAFDELNMTPDDVQLCYLPLPHIFQKIVNVSCWMNGTQIAFYSGDILKLKDDIQAVRPTIFFTVPRLLNRFYDAINDQFKQITGFKKTLIDMAIKAKLSNLREDCDYTHAIYDKLVFSKIKDAFGGRIRYVLTGSAPVSKEVLDFFKIVFGCPVYEAYGQTEGCGLQFMTSGFDKDASGKVGGIREQLEMKLVDVPEMNYFSTDKDEHGVSMPRGEICIRGYSVIKGYFKDHEKTKEAIDDDKWLHSGDIGMMLPDGALKIIDRKKNIFKLSQGEYVAPERIENVYTRSRGIQETYVHGDSLQNYCIAVIVVNPDEMKKIAAELNIQKEDIAELCKDQQIISFYLKTLSTDGKSKGLHTFEIPQKIHLEHKPFALSGLCTQSMKLQRFQAKEFYKQILHDLYLQK